MHKYDHPTFRRSPPFPTVLGQRNPMLLLESSASFILTGFCLASHLLDKDLIQQRVTDMEDGASTGWDHMVHSWPQSYDANLRCHNQENPISVTSLSLQVPFRR